MKDLFSINGYRLVLIFQFFALFITGCEKIIDIDLNEVNPAIVVEGNLSLTDHTLEVIISQTGSYFETKSLQKIKGAAVILENDTGNRYQADETKEGIYINETINTTKGQNYKLVIEFNGIKYSASGKASTAVVIDSVSYELQKKTPFYDEGYRVKLYFTDPPMVDNYYRLKIYKNGFLMQSVSDLVVFDDSGIDGKPIEIKLRGQIFDKGDEARIEMLSIDKSAWRYFTTLRDIASLNPGSPSPANPVSNFDNGALGYFSVWSHDSKSIIIK